MELPKNLQAKLKTYALIALPYARARADEYMAEHGVALDDLDGVMLEFVMQGYAKITAATPLALTTIDDDIVKAKAKEFIEQVKAQFGPAMSEYIHAPILNEPTLKPGGLT